MDDGAIGKSYLWIIDNISKRKNDAAINPDRIIDLEEINPVFNGQKIESVCLVRDTKKSVTLVLAADNDNGTSTIFTLTIQ
jgi:hypothetical protein